MTLDSLADFKRSPDLIKIDVEGAEMQVLQGPKRLLEGDPTLLIEVGSEHAAEVAELLRPFGYRFFDAEHPDFPECGLPPYSTLAAVDPQPSGRGDDDPSTSRGGEMMAGSPRRWSSPRIDTSTSGLRPGPSGTGHIRARLAVVGPEVDRLTEEIAAAQMLDYGGETGVFAELAAQRAAHVVCLDRSLPMLQYGRAHREEIARLLADAGFDRPLGNVQRVAGDDRAVSRLPGSFDIVLAIAVLEYVEDCVGLIGRLAALLRPGGTLLVTVPEPRSPLRWAQRIIGPLAAATRPPSTRIADQSFAVIRPHGDKVPWRQGAEAAGLSEQAVKRIALGEAGLHSRFHPTALIRLQRNEAIDG